ncbi:MAG: class I SAM-dependent methyltransferase [Candidatus Babeliales bacterium]
MTQLKKEVAHYWNQESCGTEHTQAEKFSLDYFKSIEEYRYTIEPEIFSFAQFTRFHKKKILEVGIGAGTDFLQWIRAGSFAYGIDLTQEALDNTKKRLALENLQAHELQTADAENLPYQNNFFDCVYSWGVIHHSPDTVKCLEEIIRVTKPNGVIKIMIYNRYSLFAFYRWFLAGFCKGRPFKSLSWILYNHQESKGTKAYTFKEIKKILKLYPVEISQLDATVTKHDLLYYKSKPIQWFAYLAACLFGWHKAGWFMKITMKKKG